MMPDALYDLLKQYLPSAGQQSWTTDQDSSDYLVRLSSLRPNDLSTSEHESLQQASQSNNVSIKALSSRSHRITTTSFDHLTTLAQSLNDLSNGVDDIRDAVPQLDESAVSFASAYNKSKETNTALTTRRQSMILAEQADKLQDILELPALLKTTIAAAGRGSLGANYSQALDLFAHIKRLQILHPKSDHVRTIMNDAHQAMKDMTRSLIISLRSQNIRLAAAIRTIGWLRRLIPEISGKPSGPIVVPHLLTIGAPASVNTDEDEFGAIFLCARLCTFLNMTEALAPFRDLADQETSRRLNEAGGARPEPVRRPSHAYHSLQGQQTERYLKKYIEIFREHAFATISMFRNIFPPATAEKDDPLQLPSALASFPLHLVEMLMETLKLYLPNVTDAAMRESLLMQVLYAANSLGRLGADFSMMIANLPGASNSHQGQHAKDGKDPEMTEPEWVHVIKKHRVQAARLEALAASRDQELSGQHASDIKVR